MYGKWVEFALEEEFIVKVFVFCTPVYTESEV